MKKKLISLILCGAMTFGLVSCGESKEKETSINLNKTTTSTLESSSNAKVDTEDSDDEKVESTSSKNEYKSMTKDEAIEFNKIKVYEMESFIEKEGYETEVVDDTDTLIEGPRTVGYVGSGEVSAYKKIGYSAEVKPNKATVRYEFHYYVDKEGIANGTSEVPKARDLLIAEPYKIMTGDEISKETLNKIDEAIEDAYLNGNDEDEIELEVNGPFKVNIIFDGLEITFQIISSGRGDGTSA